MDPTDPDLDPKHCLKDINKVWYSNFKKKAKNVSSILILKFRSIKQKGYFT